MTIRAGTLVKRYDPDEFPYGAFPCEAEGSDKLDVCVGVVQYVVNHLDPPVRVHWAWMCLFHNNSGANVLESYEPDNLWEVGQLA